MKLPKKKILKEDKRELTRQVTVRFMRVMYMIIITHKQSGGACRNVKAFAGSIGANPTYFSQYEEPATGRNVTVEMCCELCQVHGVNANWLLMGAGEMYYNLEITDRLKQLEKRMQIVEEVVIEKAKKTIRK